MTIFSYHLTGCCVLALAIGGAKLHAQEADAIVPVREFVVPSLPHLPSDKIADVFRSIGDVAKPPGNGPEDAFDELLDSANASTPAETWIEQLGSPEFARREQATAMLHRLGADAIPMLKKVSQEHSDIEVRLRAKDLVAGIASGETAGRIDEFLAGQDVSLEGWSVFRQIFGDGTKIREIFVELMLRHRDVLTSLDGTAKDRFEAFQGVLLRVQRGLFVERRMPSNADTFAAFLLANDPEIVLSAVDESMLIQIIRKEAANRLHVDPQLGGPFNAILGGWVLRDGDRNRSEEVFWVALSLDLPETLTLSLETLRATADPRSMAVAMQGIARFGDATHIELLKPLLDDRRVVTEQKFAGGGFIETQLGDVAAAAIVLLADKNLSDFGMDENATHPRFGLIIDDLGFPVGDDTKRTESRDLIKNLK